MALLPNEPDKQRKLLIALLPLLAAFAYYYFLHGPARAEVNDLAARLERLENENAAARALAARSGPDLEKKLALYEQHFIRLEQLIPRDEEVPELLHAMTLEAQHSNVDLALMRPGAEVPGPFYNAQTYEIGVIGRYHDVGRFLAAIGSLPRIVNTTQLRLMPRNEQRPNNAPARLEAYFRIRTYVLPPATSTEGAPHAKS